MKLTGTLKENVEKAESKEQAKKLIAQAGMELTEQEMEEVAGGQLSYHPGHKSKAPDPQERKRAFAVNEVKKLLEELKNPSTSPARKEAIKLTLRTGSYQGIAYVDIARQFNPSLFAN